MVMIVIAAANIAGFMADKAAAAIIDVVILVNGLATADQASKGGIVQLYMYTSTCNKQKHADEEDKEPAQLLIVKDLQSAVFNLSSGLSTSPEEHTL